MPPERLASAAAFSAAAAASASRVNALPAFAMCSSASWPSETSAGASVSRHCPAVVLGKAMTSRMEDAPVQEN